MVSNLILLISQPVTSVLCNGGTHSQCRLGPEGFRPVDAKTWLGLATRTALCWQGRSYLPVQGISRFNSTYQQCEQACPQLHDWSHSGVSNNTEEPRWKVLPGAGSVSKQIEVRGIAPRWLFVPSSAWVQQPWKMVGEAPVLPSPPDVPVNWKDLVPIPFSVQICRGAF